MLRFLSRNIYDSLHFCGSDASEIIFIWKARWHHQRQHKFNELAFEKAWLARAAENTLKLFIKTNGWKLTFSLAFRWKFSPVDHNTAT
jgi:hypothetical protein